MSPGPPLTSRVHHTVRTGADQPSCMRAAPQLRLRHRAVDRKATGTVSVPECTTTCACTSPGSVPLGGLAGAPHAFVAVGLGHIPRLRDAVGLRGARSHIMCHGAPLPAGVRGRTTLAAGRARGAARSRLGAASAARCCWPVCVDARRTQQSGAASAALITWSSFLCGCSAFQ